METSEKVVVAVIGIVVVVGLVFLARDGMQEQAEERRVCVRAFQTAATPHDTLTIAMLNATCRDVLRDGK